MTVLTGAIGAVLGALLGAFLAYRLQRAKPSFALDAIELTASFSPDVTVRPVDAVEKWAKIYWQGTNPLVAVGEETTEREYVQALLATQRFLATELEVKVPNLRKAADDIRYALALQDYREIEAVWTTHDDLIFEALAVPYMKDEVKDLPVLDEDLLEQMSTDKGRQLSYIPDGPEGPTVVLLTQTFNRDISFSLQRASFAQRENLRRFATGIAKAIADEGGEDIRRVTDHLTKQANYRERVAKEFAEVVKDALNPYLRYVARGIMANSGRASYSVHRRANLVIGMQEFATASGQSLDDLDLHVRIELPDMVSDATRGGDSPVLVGPGSAVRFIAIARDPAVRIQREEEVRKAYKGGSVKAHLVLGTTGIRTGKPRVVRTPDILFRDVEQHLNLGTKLRKRMRVHPSR